MAKTTSTATSSSGGNSTVTTTSGGGGYSSKSTGTNTKYGTVYSLPPTVGAFSNANYRVHDHRILTAHFDHSHSFTTPSHTHKVSVSVPSHTHSVSVTIPSHSHDVSYNVPAHSHKIDISAHSHTVNVIVPSHSHNIVHGIYDYDKLALCEIYIDGVLVLDNVGGDRNLNIAQYIKRNASGNYGGTHTIEIRSKSTTSNPQGLGRANVSIFLSGFVSF